MTDTRSRQSDRSPQKRATVDRLLGESIEEFLRADYELAENVAEALHKGRTLDQIRAAFADYGLGAEAERVLAAAELVARVEQILTDAGVVLTAPRDGEDVMVAISSPVRRAVTVCHGDNGDPQRPRDLDRMRQVAERAVPALYDAGYRLAAFDEHHLLPLDREQALERFAVSGADFAILTDPH
ncbi:hypothetical protein ACWEVD_00680 [Nocardia thailandica]